MTRKKLIVGLAALVIAAVAVFLILMPTGDGKDTPPSSPERSKTAPRRQSPPAQTKVPSRRRLKVVDSGPVSEKVTAIASKVKATSKKTPVPKAGQKAEPFTPTLSEEDFGELLAATTDEYIATRKEAWRIIDSLSTPEKIHWIGAFSRSGDEMTRVAALKATRVCFGTENFQRKTGTTYKDLQRRHEQAAADGKAGDSNVISVSFESLPTKREAVQINDIVRTALKDESSKVKEEAMLAAASFDVETSHTIYQYAMTSCSDDVRLAVLREAEYGDDDFKLRLQMAALDVGGEEVVKVASDGIEKATGKRFANSAEAFEWYEKNRTDSDGAILLEEPVSVEKKNE